MTAQGNIDESEQHEPQIPSTPPKMLPPVLFVSRNAMAPSDSQNYVILSVNDCSRQNWEKFSMLQLKMMEWRSHFLTCFQFEAGHLEFHIQTKWKFCLCFQSNCHCGLIKLIQELAEHENWTYEIRKASEEDIASFEFSLSGQPKASSLCQPKSHEFDPDAVIQHFADTGNWPRHLSDQTFIDLFPELLKQNLDTHILSLLAKWKLNARSRLRWMLFLQTIHHNKNNAHAQILKELSIFDSDFDALLEFSCQDLAQITLQEACSSTSSCNFAMDYLFFQSFLQCDDEGEILKMIKREQWRRNRAYILFFLPQLLAANKSCRIWTAIFKDLTTRLCFFILSFLMRNLNQSFPLLIDILEVEQRYPCGRNSQTFLHRQLVHLDCPDEERRQKLMDLMG